MNPRYVIFVCIATAAMFVPHCSQAQSDRDTDDHWSTERMAAMESKRFKALRQAKGVENFSGSAYDWRYAECHWNIDPAVKYISGTVTHRIDVLETTDSVTFDLSPALTVNSVNVDGQPAEFGFAGSYVLFVKHPNLATGGSHVVDITYQGEPIDFNAGSFNQAYHNDTDPEIWTLSEPYGARDWWPCKQVLDDKLDSVSISVTVPTGNKAGAPGVLEAVVDNGDGTETYQWMHRYPIPAYLVSLAVTNYVEFTQVVELEDANVEIVNYVYPEMLGIEQVRAEAIPPMLQLFSELFGTYPYASEKYGHCQSTIGGGMEHPTMSTMAGLYYSLSAHELAHQWFGDKVTCGSWEDIWLNEGFASYLEALTYEHLDPDYYPVWKSANVQYITSLPGGSVQVDDTTDVSRVFDGRLSYSKGAYLLHMLRWTVGDDAFFEGCQNYLDDPDLAFSYAVTPDFISIMESVSDTSLTEFFNDWYYGEGYPSYTVDWSPAGGGVALTVSQTQSDPSVSFFEMKLPVQLVGQGEDTTVVLTHTYNGQTYLVNPGFDVDEVDFDPELWILSKDNSVALKAADSIDIYAVKAVPNPATEKVRLSTFNPGFNPYLIEVVDARGRVVFTDRPAGGVRANYELNVAGFAPGLYRLRLIGERSESSVGVVVVRP